MHFSQIATAALALPVLAWAAAIPEKRQTGNCSGFQYLAVGGISIANTDSGAGDVIVQIRQEGSTKDADWLTIATIPEGTQMQPLNYLANGPGRQNLRVCRPGITCIWPAGEFKQWSMERHGDRYNFELDIGRRDSDNAFKVQCDSRGRIYDPSTTMTTVKSTTVSSTVAPPTTVSSSKTTSSKATTTTKASTTKAATSKATNTTTKR